MEIGTSSSFVQPVIGVPPPREPYAVLERILDDCIAFSGRRAKLFGALYYSLRIALIVLSACAAAKGLSYLESHAALFSLLVAIGTTLDTWLQPGVQYKGHYTYNDKFRALKSDLYFITPSDSATLKGINEAWKSLDDEYRKTVLPI